MADIVNWLRAYANRTTVIDIKRLDEAADEIEKLRGGMMKMASAMSTQVETIERLRAALREIAERKTYSETAAAISAAAIARAALGGE